MVEINGSPMSILDCTSEEGNNFFLNESEIENANIFSLFTAQNATFESVLTCYGH